MSTDRPDPILGEVIFATQVTTSSPSPSRIRAIILLLAASVALMMTGFGIIMPVFARRLDEFDSGVQALGLMTMSFALAQFLASPFMGSLSDQLGRRPLILGALAAFAAANIGFLFAPSPEIFMVVRGLEGALTAGLFPSAMGVVADIVPENKRAQSVGIVMGGYGAGFIVGPVLEASSTTGGDSKPHSSLPQRLPSSPLSPQRSWFRRPVHVRGGDERS